LVVGNKGSTTPSLYIGGVDQNGFVGFGTTTNTNSLARIVMDSTVNQSGTASAIGGMYQMFTFNPSAANSVQVGNRLVVQNSPTTHTATNTSVAQIIRTIDSSGYSNLVRGLEVVSSGGNNTFGVNTGIRTTGHTFGLQAITTGLAGGTSTPAAIYGESTGTTQGDILRLYSSTMTSASQMALFYQEGTTFTGTGLVMNFGAGGGAFTTGKFLDFQRNGSSQFQVSAFGTTTIGQASQTTNAAGLLIPFGSICVDNDGTCSGTTTGRIAAVEYLTGSTNDLAETFYSYEDLDRGDIVTAKGGAEVGKAASSSPVVGVVSTAPGITLGEELSTPFGAEKHPIALAGRVPVKVSDENGHINVGDTITLSSLDGIGMKDGEGAVVGIALEAYDATDYLSQGTVEVETKNETTGNKICTPDEVVDNSKLHGGVDSEGGGYRPTATSTYSETCIDEYVTIYPSNSSAQDVQVQSKTVKIGKIMVLVSPSKSNLSLKGSILEQLEVETDIITNIPKVKVLADINMNGKGIENIAFLKGVSNNWSIDDTGTLIAENVIAKNVVVQESLEIGSDTKATGITIYDSVDGSPYCFKIENGAMRSEPGKCSSTPTLGNAGNQTNNQQPTTNTTTSTSTTSTSGTGGSSTASSTGTVAGTSTAPTVDPNDPNAGNTSTSGSTASSTISTAPAPTQTTTPPTTTTTTMTTPPPTTTSTTPPPAPAPTTTSTPATDPSTGTTDPSVTTTDPNTSS
jgi:hypothetical protein